MKRVKGLSMVITEAPNLSNEAEARGEVRSMRMWSND